MVQSSFLTALSSLHWTFPDAMLPTQERGFPLKGKSIIPQFASMVRKGMNVVSVRLRPPLFSRLEVISLTSPSISHGSDRTRLIRVRRSHIFSVLNDRITIYKGYKNFLTFNGGLNINHAIIGVKNSNIKSIQINKCESTASTLGFHGEQFIITKFKLKILQKRKIVFCFR